VSDVDKSGETALWRSYNVHETPSIQVSQNYGEGLLYGQKYVDISNIYGCAQIFCAHVNFATFYCIRI
jgi:hypothetical protein